MARVQRYDPAKHRTGTALLDSLFADRGQTVYEGMQADMRAALSEDAESVEPYMPRKVDVSMNRRIRRDFEGDKSDLIKRRMRFGTVATFSAERIETDLRVPALWAMGKLAALSPVLTGRYKRNFVFTVDGSAVGKRLNLPQFEGVHRVGIVNLIDYSPVLENPKWHRPFQKVLRAAQNKFRGKFDVRLSFIRGDDVGIVTSSGKRKRYSLPILEFARPNTMRNTGFVYKKRQRSRLRRKRR